MKFTDLDTKTQETYADLDEQSKRYPIELDASGVLRFKRNRAVVYAVDHCNLNDLWIEAQRNDWAESDLKALYRMMGYSLCGFLEIFPKGGRD